MDERIPLAERSERLTKGVFVVEDGEVVRFVAGADVPGGDENPTVREDGDTLQVHLGSRTTRIVAPAIAAALRQPSSSRPSRVVVRIETPATVLDRAELLAACAHARRQLAEMVSGPMPEIVAQVGDVPHPSSLVGFDEAEIEALALAPTAAVLLANGGEMTTELAFVLEASVPGIQDLRLLEAVLRVQRPVALCIAELTQAPERAGQVLATVGGALGRLSKDEADGTRNELVRFAAVPYAIQIFRTGTEDPVQEAGMLQVFERIGLRDQ